MIKIIKPNDTYLTQAELERLRREYDQVCMYQVDPPSFEVWVEQRAQAKEAERFSPPPNQTPPEPAE